MKIKYYNSKLMLQKNNIFILCVLSFLLIAVLLMLEKNGQPQVFVNVSNDNSIEFIVRCKDNTQAIKPLWNEQEGLYYVLLPSFVSEKKAKFELLEDDQVALNGKPMKHEEYFTWTDDEIVAFSYNDKIEYFSILTSANLTTIFVNTDNYDKTYLDEAKENKDSGKLLSVTCEGGIEYSGNLESVSERGNSTFAVPKKSFHISFDKARSLCGIEAGTDWNLLAMFYETDKMRSKIIYDMAKYMNMEYAVGADWVDLYLNSEYQGTYLLTEAVKVGDGRVEIADLEKANKQANRSINFSELDISKETISEGYEIYGYDIKNPKNITGGYLIQKQTEDIDEKDAKFRTKEDYDFILDYPKYASIDEVRYIHDFVQQIESMIVTGDKQYKNYIDIESFAKQFLIDKITMEEDAMLKSEYFYKDKDRDLLKAGPIWDCDRSFGECYTNFEEPIDGVPKGMNEWYMNLYSDEEYYNILIEEYKKMIIYLSDIVNNKADEYKEHISASLKMDSKLGYNYSIPTYDYYDTYIKYLKFFITERMRFLCNLWNVDMPQINEFNEIGVTHTVTIIIDDVEVDTRTFKDGERIIDLPKGSNGENYVWNRQRGQYFNDKLPVYEDMVLTGTLLDN